MFENKNVEKMSLKITRPENDDVGCSSDVVCKMYRASEST